MSGMTATPKLPTSHVPIQDLRPHPQNARNGDTEAIAESLRANGQYRAIVIAQDGTILAGNHTYAAAMELNWKGLHAHRLDIAPDSPEAIRIMLADNRTSDLGRYDDGLLLDLLKNTDDLTGTGYDQEDIAYLQSTTAEPLVPVAKAPSLADRFIIPPVSVLNSRAGEWTERRRRWLDLGLASHAGRDTGLAWRQDFEPGFYVKKAQKEQELGRPLTTREFRADYYQPIQEGFGAGTSIFDPVLCELAYRWFSPEGGSVLDPYAGGSVRGLVASALGRHYTGIDLRPEQVTANNTQASDWHPYPVADTSRAVEETMPHPAWVVGDSVTMDTLDGIPDQVDLVFSCPPYFDLEQYSEDPADLSNMTWDDFLTAYRETIRQATTRLRDDRFAVYVVGEVRDKKNGMYRGFIPETIRAFEDAGLHFYNEMILVNAIGSTAYAAGRSFTTTRKISKVHQQVLVFVKGNPKKATLACGDVDVTLPDPDPADD